MTPQDKDISLSAKQRAEKIPLWVRYDIAGRKEETYAKIAAQIEEAVSDAVREAVDNFSAGWEKTYSNGVQDGFNAAKEKAKGMFPCNFPGNDLLRQCINCQAADRIGKMASDTNEVSRPGE